MKKKRYVLVVGSQPTDPKRDEEFNEWCEKIVIPAFIKIPGVLSINRYRMANWPHYAKQLNPDKQPKYFIMYELDGDAALEAWEKSKNRITVAEDSDRRWGKRDERGNKPGVAMWGHVLYELISVHKPEPNTGDNTPSDLPEESQK